MAAAVSLYMMQHGDLVGGFIARGQSPPPAHQQQTSPITPVLVRSQLHPLFKCLDLISSGSFHMCFDNSSNLT